MPSLTYDEAVARAALIAVTSYTVDLDLTSGDDETAPTYRSYTVIPVSYTHLTLPTSDLV